MGVDFLVCATCGDTFPDCGSFICCEDCYKNFCNKECANCDYDDKGYYVNCTFCKCESIEDSEVIEFAVRLLNKLDPNGNYTYKSLKEQSIMEKKSETK